MTGPEPRDTSEEQAAPASPAAPAASDAPASADAIVVPDAATAPDATTAPEAAAPPAAPAELRALGGPTPAALADLTARFEELETVLLCCDRLVAELASPRTDPVVVEAVWTTILLSYGRCFATGSTGSALTEDDLNAVEENSEILAWHKVLLQLRDHYTDRETNPRERFSVGVALAEDGSADGVGITSVRQPLVDDVTVRQAGKVAYALRKVLDERITAAQGRVFTQVKGMSSSTLGRLPVIAVADSAS